MQSDRVARPIQAFLPTFIGAMIGSVLYYFVWRLPQIFSDSADAPVAWWVWALLAVGVVAEFLVLVRFVRRSQLVNMIDRSASPVIVSLLTTIGSAGLWLSPYLPGHPGTRNMWERGSVGLDVFLPCLAIWLMAWLGISLGKRSSEESSHSRSELA